MENTKKILVIDDKVDNLNLIKDVLHISHPEYKVILSISGEEGIELAKSELPETIILDILMPGIDGFETCQHLKSFEATSHIPVLMLSAYGYDPEFRVKGLQTGADAFISKPFDKNEFVALVNVMLRIKKAEDILRKQNQEFDIYIKKQIKEFHNSEDRFLQISGYALEFFWEVNVNGLVKYISPVLEKILGYTPDEIIDKMHFTFSPGMGKYRLSRMLMRKFKEVSYFKDERLIFRHRNGKKVWISVSGFPVKDDNDGLISYRGVCQDITERVLTGVNLQKSLDEIKVYQKKLKKLNSDLTIAEEKERRRIAEYLHDGMSQTLSLAYIKLTSLLNSEQLSKTDKIIRESVELINTAIEETRTLTYELSPPILYELGLVQAIRWHLDKIGENHNICTKLTCFTDPSNLSNDMKTLLFRIVNELIVNSLKHSSAKCIEVEVKLKEKYIQISVIDDGKGFHYKPGSLYSDMGGFGLFSIRERLDSINGSLQFESKTGKGTKATVKVPI